MSNKPRVLIVDDKASMLEMLSKLLEEDCEIETARTGQEAVEALRRRPADVVLTDIRMPDMDGMEVLQTVKREAPQTEVILMTAYATVSQAVEAVKAGAYHYLTKPFEPDELIITLEKALERKELREETQILKEQVEQRYGFENIIGDSQPMQRVYGLARKAAESDTTVLLTGESGTGKELFARAVH
ncbi:MAG: sigma-54-dependent Fis family transcriptional regulator, partial [Candidatus Brocadiae bacterium]|nr:sigma-54-dependent Fis family transcriptional regulator [Candidatus Brocadiia bacterium]